MTRFLLRRLLNYIVLLAVASFLTFSLASFMFRPLDSLLQRNPRPSEVVIDPKAHQLDLGKPIPARDGRGVAGVVQGDFGPPVGGQRVTAELPADGGAEVAVHDAGHPVAVTDRDRLVEIELVGFRVDDDFRGPWVALQQA